MRGPPVALAEESRRGRDEEGADDGRINDDGDGQTDPELLDGEDLSSRAPSEHDHDEQGRRGDDASGALEAEGDGLVGVAGLVVDLLDN